MLHFLKMVNLLIRNLLYFFFPEMPQPLTQICKVRLRKQLACHWNDIEELPLPSKLKCFLVNEV